MQDKSTKLDNLKGMPTEHQNCRGGYNHQQIRHKMNEKYDGC